MKGERIEAKRKNKGWKEGRKIGKERKGKKRKRKEGKGREGKEIPSKGILWFTRISQTIKVTIPRYDDPNDTTLEGQQVILLNNKF